MCDRWTRPSARRQLCRRDGWELTLELGSAPARAAGGTGELARGASPTVAVSCGLALERDIGVDPPQVQVAPVVPSSPSVALRLSRDLETSSASQKEDRACACVGDAHDPLSA